MVAPKAALISPTSSESNEAPQASGVGKIVAPQAAKPVRHSSCATAGMPSLLGAGTGRAEPAGRAHLGLQCGERAHPGRGRDRAGAEYPGELAEAVLDQLLE